MKTLEITGTRHRMTPHTPPNPTPPTHPLPELGGSSDVWSRQEFRLRYCGGALGYK